MADVFIKNIPLTFLKEQGSSFFESDKYKNAVNLFNKIKESSSSEPGDEDPTSILPFDYMQEVLVKKFNDIEIIDITMEDQQNRVIAVLYGIYDTKPIKTVPKINITKCTSSLPDLSYYLEPYYGQEILKKARDLYNNLTHNTISINSSLLPPEKTNDPVKDVATKSIYYDGIFHPDMYDDKKYSQFIISSIAENTNIGIDSGNNVDLYRNKIYNKYYFNDNVLLSAIEDLKTRLVDKFLVSIGKSNYISNEELAYSNATFQGDLTNNIKRLFSKRIFPGRLSTYFFEQNDLSSDWKVEHGLGILNYRLFIFERENSEYNFISEFSISNKTSESFDILFNEAKKGLVVLVFDTYSESNINLINFKQYIDITNGDLNSNSYYKYENGIFKYYIDGISVRLCGFEIYDISNNLLKNDEFTLQILPEIDEIWISTDKILNDTSLIYLHGAKNCTGSNSIKVNSINDIYSVQEIINRYKVI
jgi:hypothetical protein